MTFNRREALVLTAAASVAGVASTTPTFAAEGDQHDVKALMNPAGIADHFIGAEDAAVTIIEYSSPTCPHCATFHADTYPALKEQYIDTGKVKFILRPFIRNVLDAVVFLLAESAGGDAYFEVVSAYFHVQNQWTRSDKPRDELLAIALQLGFTEESFEAALTNQELFTGMETLRNQATDEFDLTGTPTFYINGKQLSGVKSLEDLAAEIDPQLS